MKQFEMDQHSRFNDLSQEKMLLTSMIYFQENISQVLKSIPTDKIFQNENTRSVFNTLSEMHHENVDINDISLMQTMYKKGNHKSASLSLSLDHMTPSTPEQILMTCHALVSLYKRQLAYNLNISLNAQLLNDTSDDDLIEKVFKVYESLTLHGGASLEKSSKDAAYGAIAEIERAMTLKRSGKLSGVPTGSNKLDRELGGWQNDELILLAGRPGMGKTACALDFVLGAADQGFPVGFFSMEMDSEKLNYRLASARTGIKYSEYIKGNITDDEFTRTQTALSQIAKLPIYYFDDVSIKDIHRLESVATEWCRRKGVKLIFIDYIQYLETKRSGGSYEQITAVSKAVKSMQRNLKIPVIALAQLGREVEKRPDPRPLLEDLKESGQLEQDASTVIGLFNPDYYKRKGKKVIDEILSSETNEVQFDEGIFCYYLLKRRSGGHARVDRFGDIATNRFSDSNDIFYQNLMPETRQLNNRVFENIEPNF